MHRLAGATTNPYYYDSLANGDVISLVITCSDPCAVPDTAVGSMWPLGIKATQPLKGGIRVWPNPIIKRFIISSTEEGVFELYNLEGQELNSYRVHEGKNNFSFPQNAPAGVYVGKFISRDGNIVEVLRIVYQP